MAISTIKEAIKMGLAEALDDDPRVFMMGEDIGAYGGAYSVTDGFLAKYGPDRIKDTPISEAAFLGAGVGAAIAGLRPIVELMSISFLLTGIDQVVNMAANIRYMSGGQIKVPLVIRAPTGAGAQLGATHSHSFETWLAEVPGMKCVCPSTPHDALGLLRSAIADENPVFFAEPALLYGTRGELDPDNCSVPIGKATVSIPGDDITLVSYGAGMPILSKAAEMLKARDVFAEVLDLRTLSPLDIDTVADSIRKTNKAVFLDTARRTGGIMAEVTLRVLEQVYDWLDGPVVRIGSSDVPWPYSKVLEQESLPNAEKILAEVERTYGI